MALVKGHFGAFHKAQAGLCQKIRDSDTFENMASMPLIFCTAIQALTNMAHLTEEDSVLVQSGSGGVGQAAIQIAKAAGAKVSYINTIDCQLRLISFWLIDLYYCR